MSDLHNDVDLNQYEITKDDFKLIQKDYKIHDEKIQRKPTTFFKDCLRRFRKSKSSVVGAIVLGTLVLLAIFLPIFSTYNIDSPSPSEVLLAPKLFSSGTGFWDGTTRVEHVAYDQDKKQPADYYAPAVTELSVDSTPTLINVANKYAKGGYFMFVNENANKLSTDSSATKLLLTNTTSFTTDGGFKVKISFGDTDGIENRTIGEFRIYLSYKSASGGFAQQVTIQDFSRDYSDKEFDISAIMLENNITNAKDTRLGFELKAGNNQESYILIKSCVFTCNDTVSEEIKKEIDAISIHDATQSVLYAQDEETKLFPKGYWSCTGQKKIFAAEMLYCSFKYDTYAGAYDTLDKTVAISDLDNYIRLGYCSYERGNPSSFKKLSDKCPIEEVYSETTNRIGKVISVEASVCRYKELGYDSMPIFLFGTDNQGHDIVKKAFAGLRTSLILGVCTAAFCLLFGICWGAISGYFGGNVDLAMERFCDILGGIPNIIVMTLCILHLGNNFFVFFLALCMTGWMGTAARTRTQFYRFKGREYVLAARTLGASDGRLIFRHILPNSLGTIVTSSVLMIPSVIYSEASLAYLKLGLQGLHSFGVMLSDNQIYISTHPALIVFPSVIMCLMMISFNLFGNGLRDALNPSLKGSE